MKKSRISWVDLTKCAAIWFVLWGHAITELMDHNLYDNPAYLFIYSFHMPLFMMLSGLFAEKSFSDSFYLLFIKKFTQLVTPALAFGIFWYIISLFTGTHVNIFSFLKHEINCYWFLKSLFICYIITFFAWKCNQRKWFVAIIILLVFLFIQRWNITCFKVGNMLPFFYLGIIAKEKMYFILAYKIRILCCSILAFCLLFPFYSMNYAFPAYFFHTINYSAFFSYAYYLVTALSGSLIIISGCMCIDAVFKDNAIISKLIKMGSMTLGIYLWQKLILELLLPIFLQVDLPLLLYNYLFTPLISSISLVICYYFTNCCAKYNWINWVFWWGQYPSH